jgi:hypothetical protein
MHPERFWGTPSLISEAISQRLKRPGREADHSPPSIAKFKNDGVIPPLHVRLHRDNFTLSITATFHSVPTEVEAGREPRRSAQASGRTQVSRKSVANNQKENILCRSWGLVMRQRRHLDTVTYRPQMFSSVPHVPQKLLPMINLTQVAPSSSIALQNVV